jgi:hypothetical protein
MIRKGWFQKDKTNSGRPALIGTPASPGLSETGGLAAKLRPHELIAMLTHHYQKARTRTRPRVTVTLAVRDPKGRQAVIVSC